MKYIQFDTPVGYDSQGTEIEAERLQKWAYNQLFIAPELLETLIMARNVLSVACGETAPYIKIALNKIDVVISKAEGK